MTIWNAKVLQCAQTCLHTPLSTTHGLAGFAAIGIVWIIMPGTLSTQKQLGYPAGQEQSRDYCDTVQSAASCAKGLCISAAG